MVKVTELLLNALNQGDYDTYTRLCDPHMTSFEPENLGNLVDNMEYRRFCADQARQLQLQHLQEQRILSYNLTAQQVAAAASAAAASAAAALAASAPCPTPATPTKAAGGQSVGGASLLQQQQLQQIASAAAIAATTAALTNLNLNQHHSAQPSSSSTATTTTTTTNNNNNSNSSTISSSNVHLLPLSNQTNRASPKQYSLMLNPSVYLLGDEAASIAYTKLSQSLDLASGHLNVEQSEETRVWHRKDGNKWSCVHLHRSLVNNNNTINNQLLAGPQTSASLIRFIGNQQQTANMANIHHFQHQQQTSVPLISLNYSSLGATLSGAGSHQSTQSTNSSR